MRRLAAVVRPSPHFLTPRAFEVTVSNVFHDILMVVVMVVDIVVILIRCDGECLIIIVIMARRTGVS